jgi:putative colanic acid biosynthesis acetyltransferase WcaF
MSGKTDLSEFNNSWYKPGGTLLKRALWYCVNAAVINSFMPFSSMRIFWLKMFGAEIGHNVLIKPKVNIKYPWRLKIGNNVWIGESVWIDNLDNVEIGNNVCLSQGAMLLCGNHDYSKSTFDLITGKIVLEEGVWIGAKAVVCPGTIARSHAVLSVGSVASGELEAYSVYSGNKAVKVKTRVVA